MTEDARRVYELYGIDIEPKWFPVIYVLNKMDCSTVTEVAEIIGHSHPSVSCIAKEMKKRGLLEMQKSKSDGRKRELRLTEKGQTAFAKMDKAFVDVATAVEELIAESHHDLWAAMEDTEYLLEQKSLLSRVQAQRKIREQANVEILDYTSADQLDFARLNYHWIEKYFTVEAADRQSLDHPMEKIIVPGGHIFMAKYKGETVGTVAMIKMNESCYELAKMAVDEAAQGLNIGWRLGQAVVQKARDLGATRLYLESNTMLTPAISLYHKLGFKRIIGPPSPYKRSNIQMELLLEGNA